MDQQLLDFFRAFSAWLDHHEHSDTCLYGYTVSSGPAEGNKYPCDCGLIDLQKTVERIIL